MTPSTRWVIGRLPDCDIILTQTEISGRHCCLTRTARGYTLEDLGSSNGTFVNGKRITGTVAVSPSDQVVLGKSVAFPWPGSAPTPLRTIMEPVAPTPLRTMMETPAVAPLRTTLEPPGSVNRQKFSPPPPSSGISHVVTVGRSPDNEIVLDHPTVSGHHAKLVVRGDRAELEDLGSANGIFVGDRTRRVQKATITRNDVVFFGALRVPAARFLGGAGAEAPAQKQKQLAVVDFAGDVMVFGRDPTCNQQLDYPMISARHAQLTRRPDGLLLEDLGSSNGTYVNGQRITRPVMIRAGDVIGLGSYTFTLTGDGALQKRDFRGNATLEAQRLTVIAGGRKLLSGISLTIMPGEFVGLMGPSGAGKTTLMNALNGYVPPADGAVLLNGQDLYRHYDQFRSVLGYVPQDDVMHRDLTVQQALYYSARLRLPSDYSHADIMTRIHKVLDQLNLLGTEHVPIGSAEKKGISGGQRRRVNLAMELLTDPLVLFLDEPTSGLSSQDALAVMKVLRGLANEGKTILLTIHQPSLEVYRLMDHLVLVGKDKGSKDPGQLIYFGPAYPDAVHHFNPNGVPGLKPDQELPPEAVLAPLDDRKAAEWVSHYHASTHHQHYVKDRKDTIAPDAQGSSAEQSRRISPFFQCMLLVQRMTTIKLKDRMNTAIMLAQAPIVAVLIVMVFAKQTSQTPAGDEEKWLGVAQSLGTTLFLMALGALWLGASNAVREIVGEWAIYHRERMVNLRLGPYIASKYTVLGVLCTIQCLIILGTVWFFCGLKAPLMVFLLLMLAALVGTTIGLLLSALARTSEVAIALLPIVLLPMVILGGAIQPVHKMPAFPRAVTYLVPTRWAFEGMMLAEMNSKKWPRIELTEPPKSPGEMPKKKKEQDMAELFFQENQTEKYRNSVGLAIGALAAMLVLGTAGVAGILRSRDVH